MTQMYQIGKVINTHGIQGEVKVQQTTDFTELFHVGQSVYITIQGQVTELIIEQHRTHKHHHLLRFKGIQSIDDAEKLKKLELQIKEEQLPELDENQFHYHEIIGCQTYTMDRELIGEVVNILAPGANDVWVVKNKQGKEYLIPFINDVVKEVKPDEKCIIIDPMEGLLD